jgi:ferrous-iron efflux pump FieF
MSGAHSHHSHHAGRSALTQRAALASIATAIFLLLVKGYAAWVTGSMAVLGALADSGLDLLASITTLIGVRVAAMPADDNHRFGHGKAEALAAMAQVAIIMVSACAIGWASILRLGSPSRVNAPEYGMAASAIAIAATLALLAYQRHVIRATASVAIKTDQLHYSGDLLLNGAVLIALVVDQMLPASGIDAIAGVLIALWLIKSAWSAASEAIDQLMDKEWPDEKKAQLEMLAMAHGEIRGIHDVRTRSSGAHDFVQFKAYVDPALSLSAAHDIMDRVEADLEAAFPGTEILIHPEPAPKVQK